MRAYALAACADRDAEVERLRVQLAGCSVAANSNTEESQLANTIPVDSYGYSASYGDCLRASLRELTERQRTETAEARVRELERQVGKLKEVGMENDALRARLDSAQKQEPVAWMLRNGSLTDCRELADAFDDPKIPLYRSPPLLTDSAVQDDDNAPAIECWNGEKKVTVYPSTVLRSWGKNIETQMSDEPRTLKSVDDAMRWLYRHPEGGAEMAQEMQRLREIVAGLRAQIEAIKRQPTVVTVDADIIWSNEEQLKALGRKELIERPELP